LTNNKRYVIIIIENKERGTYNMKNLLARLETLETIEFMHKMKDHWDSDDFEFSCKLNKEIRELKEQLKALGWEG
jgi:hypothetical protein